MNEAAILNDFVEAYEQAHAGSEPVDLAGFLPPLDHPLYLQVFRELVRVDLEYAWRRGRPRSLDEYRAAYPGPLARPDVLAELAFEEYRLRQQLGQPVTPDEYARRYGVSTADWPGPLSLASPSRARPVDDGPAETPPAGTIFLGFELLHELGQGAFGRVYLARQGDLANRLVVLKVSADVDRECQTLAQLVHTHIVPVYSFHRAPPYQAACMPYLGATTLAHVLDQLSRQSDPPRSGKDLVSTIEQRSQVICLAGYSQMPATVRTPAAPALPELPGPPIADAPGFPSVVDGVPGSAEPVRVVRGSMTTLNMLEGLSYVDAVLWLGMCLADGLAYAHERGIVHRDLKPANVLLTDEGLPMLLDFNLADDLKLARVDASRLGGTLAYMAPEHLEAFQGHERSVDARSDLYSLGLILYQLLTRRHPFRATPRQGGVEAMLAERRQGPPPPRSLEPHVPPGLEAIVLKCLSPDPAGRYQDARHLHEDLRRQQQNRPLRYAGNPSLRERAVKWYRRHPRLAVGSAVSLLAGAVLAVLFFGFVLRGQRLAQAEALDAQAAFRDDFRQARFYLNTRRGDRDLFEKGCRLARAALGRFDVLDRPDDWQNGRRWRYLPPPERDRLRQDIGEALLLLALGEAALAEPLPPEQRAEARESALALARQAEGHFDRDAPPLLWRLQAKLFDRLGRIEEARAARSRAERSRAETARALYLDGVELGWAGQYREAVPLLERAVREEPELFAAWVALGRSWQALGRAMEAEAAYNSAISLQPNFAPLWLDRGVVRLQRHELDGAERDLDKAIGLDPTLADAHVNRALARHQRAARLGRSAAWKKLEAQAVEDLSRALELKTAHTRVYFMRARIREQLGDRAGAAADRRRGLALQPNDENSALARGMARLEVGDVAGALADFEAVLKRNPRSYPALSNKAYILAEKQGKLAEAIAVLDGAIALYPDLVPLRGGRAVYRARLGRRAEALADVRECLQRDTSAALLYQMAGVCSLLSKGQDDNHREGLKLFASALRQRFDQFALAENDPDLANLRQGPEFWRLLRAARMLQR